jgi:hypothetical protein
VPAAKIEQTLRDHEERQSKMLDALIKGSDSDIDELTPMLNRAGIDFTAKASTDAATLMAAARDHCWLQVETQGKWVDLDSSAYGIRLGDRLAEQTALSDELPEELVFKLPMVVMIESAEGDKIERLAVLDHTAPLL